MEAIIYSSEMHTDTCFGSLNFIKIKILAEFILGQLIHSSKIEYKLNANGCTRFHKTLNLRRNE